MKRAIFRGIAFDTDGQTFYYRGFLLICVPYRLECGGWGAKAAVVSYAGFHDVVVAETPLDVPMISEDAAVEYARAWETEWVDAHQG